MILTKDIYAATNGGLDVLRHFYNEIDPNNPKKALKLRSDDKRPSAGCYVKKGIWYIKDHGGSDNKSYNAIELVKEKLNLGLAPAINWIAQNFAPHLLNSHSKNNTIAFKPGMKKVNASDEMRLIRRKSGKFTASELECLGYKITPRACEEFSLIPLDGYITKAKEDYSWHIEANDQYPILFYDYGDWGKIYQPYGDLRFMYYGEKPKDFIFGTKKFMKIWATALEDKYPEKPVDRNKSADDDSEAECKDERFENLIICSGPSDALNVYSKGYEVCWLNSESEPLSDNYIKKLKRICKNLYILFDADETGIRNAQKIALQDLDIKIISLPEDLGEYHTNKRDSSGQAKPCKDIKDFMMFYKRGQIDPQYEFENRLVKLAKPLKFWIENISEKGKINYDINPACLLQFLSATGFSKMSVAKDNTCYVYVKDKIIDVIPEKEMESRVKRHLIGFIKENPKYYTQQLENMILNKKNNLDILQNLAEKKYDIDSFTKDEEYFYFRNAIIRVSADKIEKVSPLECPYYILKSKIIQHDISLEDSLYDVTLSDAYLYANSVLEQYVSSPDPSAISEIRQEIDKMPTYERYKLKIRTDFDLVRFIYNTGNKYWKREKEAAALGAELTPKERQIIDLSFINKCCALGYMMSRYKTPSNAKALYCIETSISEEDEGEHNGGSGKSLFTSFVKYLRNRVSISGQKAKDNDFSFLYQNVKFDTEVFHIDDLNSKFDLNLLLPDITGDLQVNPKHTSAFILPFEQSPKISLTSNHAINRFTGSLRRRIFFCEFSDYYHAANPDKNMKEMSPKVEFGRDFFTDYSDSDFNVFYNFMLQAVRTYLQYGMVEPDMTNIEERQRFYAIGTDFKEWADVYFLDKFNKNVDKEEAFVNFKNTLSTRGQSFLKKTTFTKKVKLWCNINGYTYNPKWVMDERSETERERNEIRWTNEFQKQVYGFYIHNPKI